MATHALFFFLSICCAFGAVTSLGIALFAGNKLFSATRGSFSFQVWSRRPLGTALIVGIVAIAMGWNTDLLTKVSFVNKAKAEERLIGTFHPDKLALLNASARELSSRPCRRGTHA